MTQIINKINISKYLCKLITYSFTTEEVIIDLRAVTDIASASKLDIILREPFVCNKQETLAVGTEVCQTDYLVQLVAIYHYFVIQRVSEFLQ